LSRAAIAASIFSNVKRSSCASLVRYIEQCSGLSPSRALELFYGLLANAVRAE
jgi:hypothetical protein